MSNTSLEKELRTYIIEPFNGEYNFLLARQYENLGHLSAAVSFYLRAAEFSMSDLLSYEALLRLGLCLEKSNNRVYSTEGVFLRAIALAPDRPEAYFLLSRLYERNKKWNECYSIACDKEREDMYWWDTKPLKTDVEYPGKYGFTFERSVAGWWIGMWDESIHLLRQLNKRSDITSQFATAVSNNLANLGRSYKRPIKYNKTRHSELRYKFKDSEAIVNNYSQCYQDMFVLTMLNGKRNGKFLEIGCDDAYFNNNTALLEKDFGWSGISIDIDKDKTEAFKKQRSATVVNQDATKIDFKKLLVDVDYDYLQIDCESAMTSLQVLKSIPFESHRFAVITFEHDNYCCEDTVVRDESRKYLQSYGYELIVNNIAEDLYSDFEDWWVHPDLVDKNIIDRMKFVSDETKKADLYILNKI